MWVLKPKKDVWHYYRSPGPRTGLCGASVPDSPGVKEQETKPAGFNGLLCNRCWFTHELNRTLDAIPDDATRNWLASLNFEAISESDRERLYGELGEDRVDSLLVIYSLAASSEPDIDKEEPIPAVASARLTLSELTAIPLALRAPAIPAEPGSDEEAAQPAEPRIKVNCTRRAPERTATGGISALLRRITERA